VEVNYTDTKLKVKTNLLKMLKQLTVRLFYKQPYRVMQLKSINNNLTAAFIRICVHETFLDFHLFRF
jgi:hypothetical protein